MQEPIVELKQVTKSYPGKLVLSSVSLAIRRGEAMLLVGGNGSGKSTLIRLIGGFTAPTSGSRQVHEARPPKIGFMPDRFPKHKFTSEEYLMHMGRIQGLPKEGLGRRIHDLHALYGLPLASQPMRSFSKGMLQKVNLMQAVLTAPDLLLLDEPLSGLDDPSVQELCGALQELKEQNVAIVISTHEPAALTGIADRIITVQNASLLEKKPEAPGPEEASIQVVCRLPGGALHPDPAAHPGLLSAVRAGGQTRLTVRADVCDQLLLQILQAGGSILEVTRRGA
ncbi:ATP-binding cassette domain-containing protein [Paenibacillus tengchongensis]|uniref:ATP-binding cassette domain-containing protein n=1 Tax=Paenibacillus tengchongensis TaxID=2608684 RepID=UPI00124CA7B2|nr:ATP-binding cassette domain-containing protein [Paenibacillus tengchongensis]